MKKLLLSIFVLASLTSEARPVDFTDADVRDAKEAAAGYCNQYNDTALRAIFKRLATVNTNSMKAQLDQNQVNSARCEQMYKRAELLGQENVVDGEREIQMYDRCLTGLMSQQQITISTTLMNAAIEAQGLRTEEAYVQFHTRRGSAEACAASYQQTQKLKALLNL